MEGAVGIEQTVGDQCVNMRMKIEVFTIGVEGENKGRNTFGEIEGELEGLGDGFLSQSRDASEKAAVALKRGDERTWARPRRSGGVGANDLSLYPLKCGSAENRGMRTSRRS